MSAEEMTGILNGIVADQATFKEQIRTLFNQQNEIRATCDTVRQLAVAIERQAERLKSISEKLDAVKKDVDELKAKPAKRWDGVVSTMITVLLTAGITYLLTRMGLG